MYKINLKQGRRLCPSSNANAKLDKHTNWEAIRKGCKMQELLARALYCKADVAVRKCGIEDVKLFQAVMNDVQIHVVSKEHFNSIIYQGPEAVSKIYLYFHDEQKLFPQYAGL
ncbi:MAG: hypothetical protein H0A76_13175 [Candidatus Thiodubiliella endoseptemdiera]|uniref:Uncharacterized protein n=1 Tax=Candidatus Thiodubiliella endoseptemdiera TaxID=2738886 RepID=A0A853F5Q5_9GAMM|nr:hypothetical protein [Candidatus Thiodubiliella endoseptemdiera]